MEKPTLRQLGIGEFREEGGWKMASIVLRFVWQDISADAFMDIDFIMAELQRALHPAQARFLRGEP